MKMKMKATSMMTPQKRNEVEHKFTSNEFKACLSPSMQSRFDALAPSKGFVQAAKIVAAEIAAANAGRAKAPAKAAPSKPAPTPTLTAEERELIAQAYRNVEARHAAASSAADAKSAELDAIFGLAQPSHTGVTFDPKSGVQTFGSVSPATSSPSKPRPVASTAPYVAPTMPAPSPGLTRAQREALDAAFSTGHIADGVTFDPSTGVQSFGVAVRP